MFNRLDTAGNQSRMVNPLQILKWGQTINNSQRQAVRAVAFGHTFMTLFRAIAGVFLWMNRSINEIHDLRVIFELSDRQLAERGIKRSQIATRCAEGWFA